MVKTTPKFTKEDFLNARSLVAKLNNEYDQETIQKALKSEHKKKTKLKNQSNPTPLVYDAKWTHRESLRLHPLGLEQFKEILSQR